MGMGSLAGLLKGAGYQVSGSDANVYPPMSEQLQSLGIPIAEGYRTENVPDDADLVIIGNAVSKDHPEVLEVQRRKLPFLSMADAVAEFFFQDKISLVVAGTHGKTTTASMLAWLLTAAGRDPSFLVGGILKNFDQSWQLGPGDHFVIEGDEYDTAFFDKTPKFLHYRPHLAVLNPVEFDHADIYQDLEQILSAFREFVGLIPSAGQLFACGDSANVRSLLSAAHCPVTLFGEEEDCDYRLLAATTESHHTVVQFCTPTGEEVTLQSPLPGRYNAMNLLGIYALLEKLGLSSQEVQQGLDRFEGIRRRQEVRGVVGGVTVIDDFAHHPTAVRETLTALKQKYAGQKLWAVFEPRSNTSRTRAFQTEWPPAFAPADETILALPYDNGKIPPEQLLDVEAVATTICQEGGEARSLDSVEAILEYLAEHIQPQAVVAILSNGGFDGIHQRLLDRLGEAR